MHPVKREEENQRERRAADGPAAPRSGFRREQPPIRDRHPEQGRDVRLLGQGESQPRRQEQAVRQARRAAGGRVPRGAGRKHEGERVVAQAQKEHRVDFLGPEPRGGDVREEDPEMNQQGQRQERPDAAGGGNGRNGFVRFPSGEAQKGGREQEHRAEVEHPPTQMVQPRFGAEDLPGDGVVELPERPVSKDARFQKVPPAPLQERVGAVEDLDVPPVVVIVDQRERRGQRVVQDGDEGQQRSGGGRDPQGRRRDVRQDAPGRRGAPAAGAA